MNIIKNALFAFLVLGMSTAACFAESASVDFRINIPGYAQITPITSPVLIANITDKTGNLQAPLTSKFKVITNSTEKKALYLNANVITESGQENAMFEQGGQVYIAFAYISRLPSSSSLSNCKHGGSPADSPGVVAYPVTSIQGADHKFLKSKSKYEVYVDNGISYVTVNVGSNVNKNSFGANDPRGFYQAVLSLTEADI